MQCTICAVDRFMRSQLHGKRQKKNDTEGREHHEQHRQPSDSAGRETDRQARADISRWSMARSRAEGRRGAGSHRYISLDAANRAWMHGATYRAAVEANTVMAAAVSRRSSPRRPQVSRRAISYSGDTGWQDYAAVPAKHLTRMPRLEPMTHLLSV
jgi:hypothetical protein